MRRKGFKIPKNPFGSPKKIAKRGFYEMFSILTGGNTKTRDYGKRIGKK